MKVICAPDDFKESLSAGEAAAAMARGVQRACPTAIVDQCPIADGGDGTVEAIYAATKGEVIATPVAGPRGDMATARWCLVPACEGRPATAVIEMAAASGMAMLAPQRRDPMVTSSFGTGQLILAALDVGAQRLILGIGGSATNDGGCGAAAALGARFVNAAGQVIGPQITGGQLASITEVDLSGLDPRLDGVEIQVACDVRNPLIGPQGAAAIYGPQKGATAEQVELLDAGLAHLSEVIQQSGGANVAELPGAGAAGGMGWGMVVFLAARLQSGVGLVLEAAGFEHRVIGADLCLTGEGRLDGQSLAGKACLGVATAARRHGVDTVALVGEVGPDAELTLEAGLTAYRPISPGMEPAESMRRAAELLEQATFEVIRAWPDKSVRAGG